MTAPTTSDVEIIRLPMLRDNYSYLVHHHPSQTTAVVDPAEALPVIEACQARHWTLNQIWNTHHHADHTGGNLVLKDTTRAVVHGASHDASRIPGLDVPLQPEQTFTMGDLKVRVMDVAGHTVGHIAYVLDDLPAVFCGDALFSLGCGRMFEGNPVQFWNSLLRLRALPDETSVYCAHEYTQSNLKFARHVDPDNADLAGRGEIIDRLRAAGTPTVPCLLGDEKKTNPFLRADDAALAAHLGLAGKRPDEVFAHLRAAKDTF